MLHNSTKETAQKTIMFAHVPLLATAIRAVVLLKKVFFPIATKNPTNLQE